MKTSFCCCCFPRKEDDNCVNLEFRCLGFCVTGLVAFSQISSSKTHPAFLLLLALPREDQVYEIWREKWRTHRKEMVFYIRQVFRCTCVRETSAYHERALNFLKRTFPRMRAFFDGSTRVKVKLFMGKHWRVVFRNQIKRFWGFGPAKRTHLLRSTRSNERKSRHCFQG